MKLVLSRRVFEKHSKKFKKTHSVGSRVSPCGQKGRQAGSQSDMTKMIVAVRNFGHMLQKSVTLMMIVVIEGKVVC